MSEPSSSATVSANVLACGLALLFASCAANATPAAPDAGPGAGARASAASDGGAVVLWQAPPDASESTRTSSGASSAAPKGSPSSGHMVHRSRDQMGTLVDLYAWIESPSDKNALTAFDAAFDEITRLERLMSPYIESSDVSRVNAAAGKGPTEVSQETFEVVEMAQKVARLSGGLFDITFAAMKGLWNFDNLIEAKLPNPADVKARIKKIDYRRVVLNKVKRTIAIGAGQRIDLGGIAKGYVADKAGAVLKAAGLTNFMVQAGGDLLASGRRGDRAWHIGIRDPRGPREKFFAVGEVVDHAFSTSGDYERFFMFNGKRYHHIIDPRTGYPTRAARAVTLYAPDAFTADALDTTVLLLGPEKGLKLLEKFPGVGAVIVDNNNKVHWSPNLKGVVKFVADPTPGE